MRYSAIYKPTILDKMRHDLYADMIWDHRDDDEEALQLILDQQKLSYMYNEIEEVKF